MKDQVNQQEEYERDEEQETLDFSKPDYVFIPKGNHNYRQAGPYLVCNGCEIQHAIWIGMEKLMVGVTDTGEPILKLRKDLGM